MAANEGLLLAGKRPKAAIPLSANLGTAVLRLWALAHIVSAPSTWINGTAMQAASGPTGTLSPCCVLPRPIPLWRHRRGQARPYRLVQRRVLPRLLGDEAGHPAIRRQLVAPVALSVIARARPGTNPRPSPRPLCSRAGRKGRRRPGERTRWPAQRRPDPGTPADDDGDGHDSISSM